MLGIFHSNRTTKGLRNQGRSKGWLVGCFGFNGPLRQYFSLYRIVSHRKRREKIADSKNVQTAPPAPTASVIGPCPTLIQIVGRPGTGSLPRTIVPPDHPQNKGRGLVDRKLVEAPPVISLLAVPSVLVSHGCSYIYMFGVC